MSDVQYDGFGDVIGIEKGVFNDSALTAHDQIKVVPTPSGAAFELHCERCGNHMQVTVRWDALMALKYGISPHVLAMVRHPLAQKLGWNNLSNEQWAWDNREVGWRMQSGGACKCGNMNSGASRMVLGQQEPEQILAQGRVRRFISPQAETQVSNLLVEVAQQAQQGQR